MIKKPLFDYLILFNEIVEKNKFNDIFDLSSYDFLAPPTLLPLIQYMEQNGITKYYAHPKTKNYLEMVFGREKSTVQHYP